MLHIFSIIFLGLMATACGGPRYVDFFPYYYDGAPKPKVAVIPLLDRTKSYLDAIDLSNELTLQIYERMRNDGLLYLVSQSRVQSSVCRLGQFDFFRSDEILSKEFNDVDFVVLTELIKHQDVRVPSLGSRSPLGDEMLHMQIRLRVIDVRRCPPQVVLQEIFTYWSPLSATCVRSSLATMDPESYRESVLGKVDRDNIRKLVARIESVIQGAY